VDFLVNSMAPLRNVLVAVDASAHSAPAWRWAVRALLPLLPPGSSCRVLCVATPDDEDMALDNCDAPWTIPSDSESRRESLRRAAATASDTLRRLVEDCPPPPGVQVTLVAAPLVGSVGETIAAALAQQPAELVVMGQRGRGALKRFAQSLGASQRAGFTFASALAARLRSAAQLLRRHCRCARGRAHGLGVRLLRVRALSPTACAS